MAAETHPTAGRTTRLELDDQSLREWDATVLDSSPDGIVLDRSAFYPGGGGHLGRARLGDPLLEALGHLGQVEVHPRGERLHVAAGHQ